MTNGHTKKVLIVAIVLILICAIGSQLIIPLLGIAIAMTGAAWGIIVATISLFAIGALLFFILPGLLVILISLFALGWVILSLILFPFLFPLVIPVFIILLCIAYLTRNRSPRE